MHGLWTALRPVGAAQPSLVRFCRGRLRNIKPLERDKTRTQETLSCGAVLLQQILRYTMEFPVRLNEECFPAQSILDSLMEKRKRAQKRTGALSLPQLLDRLELVFSGLATAFHALN